MDCNAPNPPCGECSFADKIKYMRENNSLAFTFVGGRQDFHDNPSIHQQEKDQVAALKAKGQAFERADQ